MGDILDEHIKEKTAHLLKLKGFDEPVHARYSKGKYQPNILGLTCRHNSGEINNNYISAPTQSQVLKWLRVKHNLYIQFPLLKRSYFYDVWKIVNDGIILNERITFSSKGYQTPEEAIEAGITYCLNKCL